MKRPRARELGLVIRELPTGEHNAITDARGVLVGYYGVVRGERERAVRTGITAVLPHPGNLFEEKVPEAVFVINGYGKSLGLIQIQEVREIEAPIILTSTLDVWRVADAVLEYTSEKNPEVRSFNPVVLECNDSELNNALGRHIGGAEAFRAIKTA